MMPLARVVACACVPAAFNHRPRRWLLQPWRAMAAIVAMAGAPWRRHGARRLCRPPCLLVIRTTVIV